MKDYYYYSESSEEIKELLPKTELVQSSGTRNRHYYIAMPATFDIETTTIPNPMGDAEKNPYIGFMYHWQFAIQLHAGQNKDFLVVLGRRWEEFQDFMHMLIRHFHLNESRRLVIYVHGLFFEFQFMRLFMRVESVFARHKREPMKALCNQAFEFRCSFYLSNMSLAKFIKNTPNAIYSKLSGKDYDYRKVRTPDTEMSELEIEYCLNDVRGLLEAIIHKLEEDNLATIPLTSTGYIRREVREAVLTNPSNRDEMLAMKLSPRLYVMCKEASRGGNSHSNAYLANQTLEYVKGYDRKSSYPAEMIVDKYPVTAFREVRPSNENRISYTGKAMLMFANFYKLDMKTRITIPYIPLAKCCATYGDKRKGEFVVENGRVVKAKMVSMIITDIDYKIIESQYNFEPEIEELYIAEYGYLNDEFRKNLMETFITKTKLERGDPYIYAKFKNKINAYFGMMLTDICSAEIEYTNGQWKEEKNIDIEAKLAKYYKSRKSFLSYQHGIWVTANARYRHQQGIEACGVDIVMGDTDSCYFINDHKADFDRLNKEWIEVCENNDIVPIVHVWESPTILGIWNEETTCVEYKTLGAKKHAYKKKGSDHYGITVAGLNKEDGAKWLTEKGSLDYFRIGEQVPADKSGRTVAYYHDAEKPFTITVDGCEILTGASIGVLDATYTLGVSDDYYSYLLGIDAELINEKILMEESNYEKNYQCYE